MHTGQQRLRLVHSVAAQAPAQRGALWYRERLPTAGDFELSFSLHFHRPSTCALPAEWAANRTDDAPPAEEADTAAAWDTAAEWAAAAEEVSAARLRSGEAERVNRLTRGEGTAAPYGCGADGDGAIGGEGLALVLHDDPAATDAAGCVGPGLGYASDASYYSRCHERIRNSVALQFVAHQNVTQPQLRGPFRSPNATHIVEWSAFDTLGVYAGGDNTAPITSRTFRSVLDGTGGLLDGAPHHVRVLYAGALLSVFIDHDALPAFAVPLDLAAHAAVGEDGHSWVGFTASTGLASMDADVLSFTFCGTALCTAQ